MTVTGTLAFISGQVADDPQGDLATQTRQALSNLESVLTSIGADWTQVVKLGWFVTDTADLPALRAVRDEFLRPALGDRTNPASTLVQVAALFQPGLLIEVEAIVALS